MGILDDEKVLMDELDDNLRRVVLNFIDANYLGEVCVSETVNSDGKYEACSLGDVSVRSFNLLESLTNDMFVWTTVCGSFECRGCLRLKSLLGAPQIVGQDFRCDGCVSLSSLDGAPSKVLGEFICCGCKGLTREEIRLYKKNLIRNIPHYASMKRSMKNLDELSSATIGKPRWGEVDYRIAVHGSVSQVEDSPCVHIYLLSDISHDKFDFVVSMVDILCKDEVNLIRQTDEAKNVIRANENECSWEGYESIYEGLMTFLSDKSTIRPYASCENGLHASIAAYNAESNSRGNALKEYLDGRDLSILPQYAKYLNEED